MATSAAGLWSGRVAWWRRVRGAIPAAVRARWPQGVRAGLAMGVPMVVLVALGHAEQAGFAGMGALAAVYLPTSPYRFRGLAVALIGVAIVLGTGYGAAIGGNLWLAAAGCGIWVAAVSLVCQAAELPPPREVLVVLPMLASTEIPSSAVSIPDRMLWTLVGAGCAWLITMSPILRRAPSPERHLVDAARLAVAELLDATGTDDLPGRRHAAAVAMRAAMLGVGQSGRRDGPLIWELVAIDRVLQAALLVALDDERIEPALPAAVRGDRTATEEPAQAEPGTHLRLLQDRVRQLAAGEFEPIGAAPGWGSLVGRIRAALGQHTLIAPSAARIGLGVLLAVLIGRLFGLSHAYWIALATCAVLQGSNLSHVRGRMLSRVGGTLAGVGLTFVLFAMHPPLLAMVVVAAVMQVVVESVIVVSYGIAVVAITVLSMLLFHLGAPGLDIGSALGSRVLDTLIGAVLALLLRRLLWHRQTSTRLGAAQARVISRSADVLQLRWAGITDIRFANARHHLHTDLASLRALADDALIDFAEYQATGAQGASGLTDRVVALAYLALSWPPTGPPGRDDAAGYLHCLDDLALAARSGSAPGQAPVLPGHPRTEEAAADIHRVLSGCGRTI